MAGEGDVDVAEASSSSAAGQQVQTRVPDSVWRRRSLMDSVEYPWRWYDPCSQFWPTWLVAMCSSVSASKVCSKFFNSSIGVYRHRVLGAAVLSAGFTVCMTSWLRDCHCGTVNTRKATATQGALFGALAVGPVAGFLGGAAVSQPTDKIRYKSNPFYFTSHVLHRYCMSPWCVLWSLAGGYTLYALGMQRVAVEDHWREQRKQALRQRWPAAVAESRHPWQQR